MQRIQLQIIVKEAYEFLRDEHTKDIIDSYISITIGSETHQTSVKKNTIRICIMTTK